jgi:hypothetical protein
LLEVNQDGLPSSITTRCTDESPHGRGRFLRGQISKTVSRPDAMPKFDSTQVAMSSIVLVTDADGLPGTPVMTAT